MKQVSGSIGRLSKSTIIDDLVDRTIEYIWSSLVPWMQDPSRPHAQAEEDLNAQFHNFLQSRAYDEFPMVYFQHEQRQHDRRRVDLSAKPLDDVVIQGITYSKYEPIIVIEGKRLPAPTKARRLEYITGVGEQSGGIQRFKLGLHGGSHDKVILLGYIQNGAPEDWHLWINSQIRELSKNSPHEWSEAEFLSQLSSRDSGSRARSTSVHPRAPGFRSSNIRIVHFWIKSSAPSAKLVRAPRNMDRSA